MKPRSSVISVLACLIILFACFTQIGATAYIGNVSLTLDRSSRYESSYVVEPFNSTHYQATNGTSGAVSIGPITNATTVINYALSHLTVGRDNQETVALKGSLTLTAPILLDSRTTLDLTNAKLYQATGTNKNMIQNSNPTGGNIYIDIIGGYLYGNSAGQSIGSGISINYTDNFHLRGTKIAYCKNDGLQLLGSNSSAQTTFFEVDDTIISHCGGRGIYMEYAADGWMKNPQVLACASYGICVWSNAGKTTFLSPYIDACTYGILIKPAGITLLDPYVDTNSADGIYVGLGADYCKVIGGSIYNNAVNGIETVFPHFTHSTN